MTEQKIGFIFPGQGSQKVGMGRDFFDHYPLAKRYFLQADDYLGYGLSDLCFNGPQDKLTLTIHAQPALYVLSCIIHDLLKDAGVKGLIYAGHSLGEITAYYASGFISFTQGLDIIKHRSEAMLDSYPSEDSAMCAVIGLTSSDIEKIIQDLSQIPVVCANYNAPLQTVISGKKEGVEQATALLKNHKAKVIPLPVSGAFHSPLMNSASESLSLFMGSQTLLDGYCPIVLNRTGTAETDPHLLKENISLQVIHSVQWVQSMTYLSEHTDQIIECGSGKVLSGLMKKINPEHPVSTVNTLSSFDAVLDPQVLNHGS